MWAPNYDEDSKLDFLVLKSKTDKRPPFKLNSFDAVMHMTKSFTDGNLWGHNKKFGYLDVKYMLYGNGDSLPLSIKAHVSKEGYAFICEPSAWWGELPKGFERLWKLPAKMFLTENVVSYDDFEFDQGKAKEVPFFHSKNYGYNEVNGSPGDGQGLCAQVSNPY